MIIIIFIFKYVRYETASKENEQYKVRIENLIKTIDNLQETCRTQDHDAVRLSILFIFCFVIL